LAESIVEEMLGEYVEKFLILVTDSVKNLKVTQMLWKPVVEAFRGSLESVANSK
jgi:hypothetical protein